MSTLLKLIEISKAFAGVEALKRVSFDLRAGEAHALVGENGAGKSTLIKVITGAHAPDSGTIEIQDQPVADLDPQSARDLGIAAIYQQPALFGDLTVAENIAIGLEGRGGWRRLSWSRRRRGPGSCWSESERRSIHSRKSTSSRCPSSSWSRSRALSGPTPAS